VKHSRHGWFLAAVLLLGVPQFPAQTQNDMNQDACAQYKQADQALNAAYSKVLRGYAKDTEFLVKLKQAQRAWIVFRDAHLAARFPSADKAAEYGSSYPACRCVLLAELTRQRVQELQVWADGIPEGDVCNGSVKTAAWVTGNQSRNRQCSKPAGM
jgi:uncharacterized protein YecT (DUF1311 family)